MSEQVNPRNDYLLVKLEVEQEVTTGGIHLPETFKDRPRRGTVVAVGPGKKSTKGDIIPMECQVGEKVMFGKVAGVETKIAGEKHYLVQEKDILVVLN